MAAGITGLDANFLQHGNEHGFGISTHELKISNEKQHDPLFLTDEQ